MKSKIPETTTYTIEEIICVYRLFLYQNTKCYIDELGTTLLEEFSRVYFQ
jgi:hypothetical protein